MTTAAITPNRLFGDLPFVRTLVTVHCPDSDSLPPYLGSAWRGLLGWGLESFCPFSHRSDCDACIARGYCPLFRLYADTTSILSMRERPRGYVFSPLSEEGNRERRALEITLFGDQCLLLPFLLLALHRGARRGLGTEGAEYKVMEIRRLLPDDARGINLLSGEQTAIMDQPANLLGQGLEQEVPAGYSIKIRFHTPVRLRSRGKYLRRMDWSFFFISLVRRVEALSMLYDRAKPLGSRIYRQLKEQFNSYLPVRENLCWNDLERYSSRQKRRVPMGGLSGEIELGEIDATQLQWWRLAQLVHVGKGAAMGLGRIEIIRRKQKSGMQT